MSISDKPRILIIDNDDGVVAAITTRLEGYGYHCLVAQNGLQGITEFTSTPVDLIVTDLNMPMLDGVGLIEKIRAVSEVPIIVITGFYRDFAEGLRGKTGVQVLGKPFSTQDFIDIVETELYLSTTRNAA